MIASLPSDLIIEITYLIATALFILSLKWMSSPATARHGVWAGELGMLLAIAGTLLHRGIIDYKWLAIALVLGSIIGVPLGKVQMTAVPQRTALSHAFGALCVTLVGTAEFYLRAPAVPRFMMAVLGMEVILGSLTFTGSLMAAGKLQENVAKVKEELNERWAAYKKLMDDAEKLDKKRRDPVLNADSRAKSEAELQSKAQGIKSLERDITEFQQRRQGQLQQEQLQERKGLYDEIMLVVSEKAKKAGYDIVLDKTGVGASGVPFILHAKDGAMEDFTGEVTGELNKNAPADSGKKEDSKKEEPKKEESKKAGKK